MTILASSIEAIMSEYGRDWTIRRETVAVGTTAWSKGTVTARTYYPVVARGRAYRPSEVQGNILERDMLVTMQLSAIISPRVGDYISPGYLQASDDATASYAQIINVYEVQAGDGVALYKIQARR